MGMSAVGTLHFPRCDCVRAAVGTTSLTAPRVKMSNNIQISKYSLSAQSQQDWCHFCKCFVQSHPNAKRNHEQSNGHKRNVELKMKEIRKQKQNEGKEEEAKKRMMASMEAAAAAAYKADLAAGARPEDTHVQKPISGEARLRQEQEGAKRELEEALERELKARAEAEYREKGEWKFDDRSNYYWHAKSSHYYDPKTKMYFDHKASAWKRLAPPSAPPPPDIGTATVPVTAGPSRALEKAAEEGAYPLGPFSESAAAAAPSARGTAGGAGGGAPVAAADAASGSAGWSHAPAGKKGSTAGGLASVTSMFNLGYGTNHPKFEAAKARTQSSAARAMAGAGGSSFEARDSRQLGAVTKEDANGGKRKREENVGKKPKVSKEEAAALARREAARARVQARSMKGFGLQ